MTPHPQAKVQSLLPRKLKGIATATAITWAVSSPTLEDTTRSLEHDQVEPQSRRRLTAKKRDAWNPGRLFAGPKVQ